MNSTSTQNPRWTSVKPQYNSFFSVMPVFLSLCLLLSFTPLAKGQLLDACDAPPPCVDCCNPGGSGSGNGNGNGNGSGDGDFASPNIALPSGVSAGVPSPGVSANPVYFLNGSVIESTTDVRLTGPTFSWAFFRKYDSIVRIYATDEAVGNHWFSGATGPTIKRLSGGGPVNLIISPSANRVFEPTLGNSYTSPKDYNATLESSGSGVDERYTLTEHDTGNIFVFYGFSHLINSYEQGRLKMQTTRERITADPNDPGTSFAYNSEGFVSSITPPPPQDTNYSIDFEYYTTGQQAIIDKLKKIEVKIGSKVLQRAEYWYQDNAGDLLSDPNDVSEDLGSSGDLIQVRISTHASEDAPASPSIVRTTQYRYYKSGGTDEGEKYQIKMVFEPDAIQRVIDYDDSDLIHTPEDLLSLDDTNQIDGIALSSFASRSFTYYTEDLLTDNNDPNRPCATTWYPNGEDLEAKYGGRDHYELTGLWGFGDNGVVKSETINGTCASCSGDSSGGIRKEYYYISGDEKSQFGNEDTQVSYIIVEDTVDADGDGAYRNVYGIGYYGQILRKVHLSEPASPDANNMWCWSMKLNSDSRITQSRMPSAHAGLDPNDLGKFFSPYTASHDSLTVDANEGVVYHYEYDPNYGNGKYLTDTLVSEGTSGTKYYLSASDWTEYNSSGVAYYKMTGSYDYPDRTQDRLTGNKTSYNYTFWAGTSDQSIKKLTRTLPKIPTSENGAGDGGGDPATTFEKYYDKYGRLRWTKDGEGYVNYYSYHPHTGGLAYTVVDVDPNAPGSGVTSGSSGKWISWNDGSANSNKPSRGSGLATPLSLVTKHEFDELGRINKTTDPGGATHYMAYQAYPTSGIEQTIRWPYWDSGAEKSLAPITVVRSNSAGVVTERFSIVGSSGATDGGDGIPYFLSAAPPRSDYVSWTRYFYNKQTGQLTKSLRYHDIPSSGDGAHLTHYYATGYDYDELGRPAVTVQTVQSTSGHQDQISRVTFDTQDRVTKTEVDCGNSSIGSAPDPNVGSLTLGGLQTASTSTYDSGGVGDSHVTRMRNYYDPNQYIETNYHRTWRGHLRGIDRKNGGNNITPFTMMDVDWLGRTIATAQYSDATLPTFPTDYSYAVVNSSDAPLTTVASDHYNVTVTKYDDLGRVYRTLTYPGTEHDDYLIDNNYYDRNDRMICSGQDYGAFTEYAYDGAGRQYMIATVVEAPGTGSSTYTSGQFNYSKPEPKLDFNDMDNGNDKVVEFTHREFDTAGNVIAERTLEMNHDDYGSQMTSTTGIYLDTPDFVQRTAFHWYDGADRRIATADYGSGDPNSGTGIWGNFADPNRLASDPNTSTNTYLVMRYAYDDAGRMRSQIDPDGIETRTFYDDLGRRTFVAENFKNFSDPSTGIGGGTNDEEDRVTGWTYNGLGQTTKLTAYNASSSTSHQETDYQYTDPYNASLITETTYPDGTAGSDSVRRTYNLDGSIATLTDQRGIAHTYTYNNRRQLELDSVNTAAGVDSTVRSIERTYDDLGRITSIASNNSSSTVLNEIEYSYGLVGKINNSYQQHDGEVSTSTSPKVQYVYDRGKTNNVYDDALRLKTTVYPLVPPNGSNAAFMAHTFAHTGSVPDRLSRSTHERVRTGAWMGGDENFFSSYKFNGANRLVGIRHFWNTSLYATISEYDSSGSSGKYPAFDRFGRTLQRKWFKDSTIHDQVDYTYDHAGNRLTRGVTNFSDLNHVYTYDDLHRLKSVDEDPNGATADDRHWTYDQLGNWEKVHHNTTGTGTANQTRTHNDVNELTSSVQGTQKQYAFDDAGNMTDLGNGETTLVYDAWNRLVIVKDRDDNTITTNEYDGLNRRIVRDETGGGGQLKHFYYNLRWQVLVEADSNNSPTCMYSYLNHYVDAVATRIDPNKAYAYLYDANFNVTAMANTNATVVERYHYSPYGEVSYYVAAGYDATLDYNDDGLVNGSDFFEYQRRFGKWKTDHSVYDNEYLYTGRRLDPESELQYSRHRFYAAHLGRWVNRDPIGYWGGDANLYGYVRNDPIYNTDPSGLANFWNPVTWGLSNPSQGWGGFFNPFSSENFASIEGGIAGTGQGLVNVSEGVHNLGAAGFNGVSATANGALGLVGVDPQFGYFDYIDNSGMITYEDPLLHDISVGAAQVATVAATAAIASEALVGSTGIGAGTTAGAQLANSLGVAGQQAVMPQGLGAGTWPALVINGQVYAARMHAVAWELACKTGVESFYGFAVINETGKVIELIK